MEGLRAIDRAATLSDILDALAASAGRASTRAAVFVLRADQLRPWRFVGFEPDRELASAVSAADNGVVSAVVSSGEASSSGEVAPFARPGDGSSVAAPLVIAGEVVGAVYADGAPQALAVEALARHASRALESIVAFKTARFVTEPLEAPAAAGADADADSSARRFARLLVSEIKLYHEPEVVAGRRNRDLASRLGGEIARARVLYEQRVPTVIRERTNYFHEELVRTLANGDPSLLAT